VAHTKALSIILCIFFCLLLFSCRTRKETKIIERIDTSVYYGDTVIIVNERVDTFYVYIPDSGKTIFAKSGDGISKIEVTKINGGELFVKSRIEEQKIKIDSVIKIVNIDKSSTKTVYVNKCENRFHNFAVYFIYFSVVLIVIYLIIKSIL
jgi:hypothetical protein